MNIGFLTVEQPNLRSGGIENVTYKLILALIARGHDVVSIHEKRKDNHTEKFTSLKTNIQDGLTNIIIDFIKANNIQILINQANESRYTQLAKQIKKRFPEIKIIKPLHADPAYVIKGCIDSEKAYIDKFRLPLCFYKLSPIYLIRKHKRIKFTRNLFNDWLNTYDSIVVLSSQAKRDFLQIAGSNASAKIDVIYNPLELKDFSSNLHKEQVVLYVGRLIKEAKRPDRVIEVWRRVYKSHPDWQLIVVGDGPMRSELERFCNRHSIKNITFTGMIDPQPYYDKASILCLTSTHEGLPMVCMEALSNGLVPVAFNSFCSLCEITENHKTSIWVKPYSIKAYASELSKLMGNPNLLKSMRNNIKNNSILQSNFSIDAILEKWESLFNHLSK